MTAPSPGEARKAVALRTMTADDWAAVASIYRQGIDTGDATFEITVPSWETWDAARLPHCCIVAEAGGVVVGFAALSPVSYRPVYAGVAEVMVYVAEGLRGRGIGGTLLETLVAQADAAGLWTLQAAIFPENEASISLHRAAGFRVEGTRERLGRAADGRWRDVVLLERRSGEVGPGDSPA